MRIQLFLLLFLISPGVYSQQPACSCRFQAILSAGIAAGQSAAKPLAQGSAGIHISRFYAGAGAGIDEYRFKSIPVYADLRMDFGRTRMGFLYAQGGYNLPGDSKSKSMEDWPDIYRTTNKFTGGFYMDAGIGYRIPINGSHRILFSAGFSHKRINDLNGYTYPCITGNCPETLSRYRYNLGRIVTKVSWEFRR